MTKREGHKEQNRKTKALHKSMVRLCLAWALLWYLALTLPFQICFIFPEKNSSHQSQNKLSVQGTTRCRAGIFNLDGKQNGGEGTALCKIMNSVFVLNRKQLLRSPSETRTEGTKWAGCQLSWTMRLCGNPGSCKYFFFSSQNLSYSHLVSVLADTCRLSFDILKMQTSGVFLFSRLHSVWQYVWMELFNSATLLSVGKIISSGWHSLWRSCFTWSARKEL